MKDDIWGINLNISFPDQAECDLTEALGGFATRPCCVADQCVHGVTACMHVSYYVITIARSITATLYMVHRSQ